MCDQDQYEKDRLEYEARGLVTRRQFGVLVGAGIALMLPKAANAVAVTETGYSVLVVNPFYRVKKAPTAEKGAATPIPSLLPLAQALNETTHMTDAKAFIAWLDQQASVAKNRKNRHAGVLRAPRGDCTNQKRG